MPRGRHSVELLKPIITLSNMTVLIYNPKILLCTVESGTKTKKEKVLQELNV